MADYKHTINLPQTDFPMRANLANREPQMLERWDAQDIYGQIRARAKGRPVYYLPDGPPYANGEIHIGHCVNKVLKDIVVKSRTLSGFDAPFVPGWDCHGLPIELQVEKKHGKVGRKLDANAFRKACREYAQTQIDAQRRDFRRLGVLGDWSRPYMTMDPAFEAEQLRAFARIIERGHVYKGYKPVHWCLDCRSALAEAEVEYQDKTSPQIDVRFEATDPAALLTAAGAPADPGARASIPIWTTTPWTLPGNRAVALSRELDYALVRVTFDDGSHEYLLLAEALVADALGRYDCAGHEIVGRARGEAFAGLVLRHPFIDRESPVVFGDHVTTEAGTGAVHTAPGHGHEDFAVGREFGLPLDNPVGPDGVYVDGTPEVAGMHIHEADRRLPELLRERGMLLNTGPFDHSYPHCWRHKTPVIFRATPQWFVSLETQGLRGDALRAISTVAWTPAWGEQRIQGMVDGRPDWCISRQRTWGVPVALFLHRDSGALHPRTGELLHAVAERVEREGVEAWFAMQPEEVLGDDAAEYEMVTDTMDVWMDSGMVHHCVSTLRPELPAQADLYLEGSDQHRGWFQSSLLTSVAMNGHAPYKAVLTHGFTVDEHGRKMSKSLGNVVAPQKVFKSLGADVLRLWVAAADYRYEMHVSDEILKRISDSYRRMRNTARFLLGNLAGFEPERDAVAPDRLVELDAWAIRRAAALQAEITGAYERFEFHQIYQKVHNFCVVDMGGFYLDVIKDRLYTTGADSHPRRSAQTAMWHIAEGMVRWLAPVLSFTAEEIWQAMPGERDDSVFLHTWHALPEIPASATPVPWDALIELRDHAARQMEALRGEGRIGSGLDAAVHVYADGALGDALAGLGEELRFVFITSDARAAGTAARSAGATHCTLERGDEAWLEVVPVEPPKCVRCWHRRDDVGSADTHPELCGRCVGNVEGPGETRRYA